MRAVALAPEAAPATGRELAARLAASIPIPTELPVRYDGERITHLSNASLTTFVACPEKFRRRYLLGIKEATSGQQFLGRRVDDALTVYYRRLIAGEQLALADVKGHYLASWQEALEETQEKEGIAWDADLDADLAHRLGRQAIEICFERLVPKLGRPVAAQRRIEFRLARSVAWTVTGQIDLESERTDGLSERPVAAVVDYKVSGKAIGQKDIDRDTQPAIYLAARWLEGHPAEEFWFARVLKPGANRKQMGSSLMRTERTVGQLRGVLVRLALAASQIAALHETFGPERPWGYAEPTSWKCSERFCRFWRECPGGAGL
jgi:hypothetical protein